jgi:membrane-associated phospholipid phosphatase
MHAKSIKQIAAIVGAVAALITGFYLLRVYANLPQITEITAITDLKAFSYLVAYATSPLALVCIALAGTFLAIEEHHVYAWMQLVASLIVVVSISWVLKEVTQIPRPPGTLFAEGFSQYSFPSTHTASAATAGMLIAYHTQRLTQIPRFVVYASVGASVFVVGLSRLVLAVHTISDVLAGIILGTGVGLIAIIAWSRWYQFLDQLNEHL